MGGKGYKADFAAAGYHAPLQLLGYDVTIDLGTIDLSLYSAVKITYGCDGSPATAENFANASSLAIGLKSEGTSYGQATDCDGTMEVYAQAVADDCGYGDYEANGEWQYVIVDMSFTSLPESRKLNTIRIDWATQPGENAKMVIGELGFFATEAEAYAYAGIEMPTEPATTEKVTEPEVTTESDSTVESATDAQSADIVDDAGCVSVVTGSAAILLVAAAAAVACKKKKA